MRIASVLNLGDFLKEIVPGPVRLYLEAIDVRDNTFTASAKKRRVTLTLQGSNKYGDLVWLSRSRIVYWGEDGEPATPTDQTVYDTMLKIECITREKLVRHGVEILPGRYVVSNDLVPLDGYFFDEYRGNKETK